MTGSIKIHKPAFSLWLLLLLLCYPVLLVAQQGTLSARLDRTQIVLGETVNLTIEMQGSAGGLSPNLSELSAQFEVINSSSQTQMSISNGQQQSVSQLLVVLEPKQAGVLTIPPISVGTQQTPALQLNVQPAPEPPAASAAAEAPDVYLEVEVDPETTYVQAQVTMLVRLLIGVPLNEASLTEPAPADSEVQKLGDDVRYEAQRQGRRYQVIERRYAIFPQQSGRLEIAPIELSGRVGANNRSSLFGSRSRGRRITRSSDPIELEVLPVPAAYSGDHWVPASALYLRETPLNQTTEYRVGEPLTRTIELAALGLSDIMLPDIETAPPIGARVYADKPVGATGQQDNWVVGQRTIKQAIVPTVAGPLELPEVRLDWWDTKTNQQQRAVLAAVTINVLPALDGGNQPIEPPVVSNLLTPSDVPDIQTTRVVDSGYWPYLSAGFAALWVLTLMAWWRARQGKQQLRNKKRQDDQQRALTISAARKACKQACRENNASAATQAVIGWARAILNSSSINNIGQVIARLDNDSLQHALIELETACYGKQPGQWAGEQLWLLLKTGLPVTGRQGGQRQEKELLLPPLYPKVP